MAAWQSDDHHFHSPLWEVSFGRAGMVTGVRISPTWFDPSVSIDYSRLIVRNDWLIDFIFFPFQYPIFMIA